jgi:hypothetical protein
LIAGGISSPLHLTAKMSNTVVEFQSAPIPASAQPTNTMSAEEKMDEKDAIFTGEQDVVAPNNYYQGGDHNEDDVEPTEEEFATLRK